MGLLKNYWFRWFAGAFITGAAFPAAASITDWFKDLEVGSGKLRLSGTSAWLMAALLCGVFSGTLGLTTAATKRFIGKSSS